MNWGSLQQCDFTSGWQGNFSNLGDPYIKRLRKAVWKWKAGHVDFTSPVEYERFDLAVHTYLRPEGTETVGERYWCRRNFQSLFWIKKNHDWFAALYSFMYSFKNSLGTLLGTGNILGVGDAQLDEASMLPALKELSSAGGGTPFLILLHFYRR